MAELPGDVIDEAARLTKLARTVSDAEEATLYRDRRAELLDEYDVTARVREEDAREVLVFHPEGWVEDGTIRPDRIDDLDRAVEIRLAGPGDPDDWDAVEAHNRDIVARVREAHGDAHGDNAAAFADFMGNHYARRVETATRTEIEEFLDEYYVRNVWPSENQRAIVERSIEHVFAATTADCPV